MTHALMSSTSLGNMSDYGLDSSMLAADGIDADIIAGLKAQTSSVNSLSQFTNIAQQAQQAGHPHPATQMVASKITKAAAKGQDTTLRIRLNPPELGRMSIKMEFNNETKAVKASIVVEKPETYMMMQRDAHLLEKALQDAGLETDSSSLNFELAQDGNEFDQNGRHGGHSDGNSPHNTGTEHDDGDEEIIETTLDWYVDPNTGAMRYDTLV